MSLTRQGQGLGEPDESDVIVVLLISVVAVDDDLGDGGRLGQLVQVVGAHVYLPALQDLLAGAARAWAGYLSGRACGWYSRSCSPKYQLGDGRTNGTASEGDLLSSPRRP